MTAPLLAVTPDSRILACVAEDRIALIDAAELTLIANGDAPPGARSIGFVGAAPYLAVATAGALYTVEVPALHPAAQVALPGDPTIAAIAGDRIVLAVSGGFAIGRCSATAIGLTELATAGPVDQVVGLDGERLLVAMPGRTEIVSAASQRVISRLAAPLPQPQRVAGIAGQRRYVYVARVGETTVTILRLSDGRTFEHTAAAAVAAIHGHADSPWIVVEHATGLERVHVQTLAGHALDPRVDVRFAACVGGGADPALYWIDPDDLRFMRTTLGGGAVVGSGSGLQLQMNRPPPKRPAAVPVPVPVSVPVPVPVSAPVPVPVSAPVPVPVSAPVPFSVPRGPRTWRPALADWAAALLASPTAPAGMPVLDGTPLDALATRLQLPSPGYRALALLYGAYLTGKPRPSLDRVGRTIAWEEIGGDGVLPRARLLSIAGGRVSLRPAVARFLDEAAPVRIDVQGGEPRRDLPVGRRRAHVSSLVAPAASARALAAQLGAAAITDEHRAGGRSGLAAALDEAWLRRLPLIAIPSGGLDLDTLAAAPLRRDHALVVVWPDRDAPPAIEDWAIIVEAAG